MTPGSTTNDIPNSRLANAKRVRNLLLGKPPSGVYFSQPHNFHLGQLCARLLFAAQHTFRMNPRTTSVPRRRTSFVGAIKHIIAIGAEKKVFGIGTSPVVAFMTSAHPGWNFSKMKLVRNAVSTFGFSGDPDHTIPIGVAASRPLPTWPKFRAMGRRWTILIDLAEKPAFERAHNRPVPSPIHEAFSTMPASTDHRVNSNTKPASEKRGYLSSDTGLFAKSICHIPAGQHSTSTSMEV